MAFFGRLMCERTDGREVGARRAYIASVVSRIAVHDEVVRFVGKRKTLNAAVLGCPGQEHVSGFQRRWRTRRDSNPWPLPSEGSALSS